LGGIPVLNGFMASPVTEYEMVKGLSGLSRVRG
jgi:hypothetical protein